MSIEVANSDREDLHTYIMKVFSVLDVKKVVEAIGHKDKDSAAPGRDWVAFEFGESILKSEVDVGISAVVRKGFDHGEEFIFGEVGGELVVGLNLSVESGV